MIRRHTKPDTPLDLSLLATWTLISLGLAGFWYGVALLIGTAL